MKWMYMNSLLAADASGLTTASLIALLGSTASILAIVTFYFNRRKEAVLDAKDMTKLTEQLTTLSTQLTDTKKLLDTTTKKMELINENVSREFRELSISLAELKRDTDFLDIRLQKLERLN